MAVNSLTWTLINKQIPTDGARKVDHIDVQLLAKDCEGKVHFTDVMLQSGTVGTSWVGHVSEIRWSFDNA